MLELKVAEKFKDLNTKNPNIVPAVVIASVVFAAGLVFPMAAIVASAGGAGLSVYLMWDKIKGGFIKTKNYETPSAINGGNEQFLFKRPNLDVTEDGRRPIKDPNAPHGDPGSSGSGKRLQPTDPDTFYPSAN